MTRSRALVALASVALVSAAGVVAASPAQARPIEYDIQPGTPAQIWHQSFGRASADAPCVPPPELVIEWRDTWNLAEKEWTATWEQWPHGNTGGWTCTRGITWAPGTPVTVTVID